MTHLKLQKLISSTEVRRYNMQFLLCPHPEFRFSHCTRSKWWKPICIPNFSGIPECTVEVKLLLVVKWMAAILEFYLVSILMYV